VTRAAARRVEAEEDTPMFFRRPSRFLKRSARLQTGRKTRAAALARATALLQPVPIERLERRQLLTTLTNTGGGQRIFEYIDSTGGSVRIALHGNISAEFIALYPAESGGGGGEPPDLPILPDRNVITDLVQFETPNDFTPEDGDFLPGADLFSIYIASADINSSIAIARVPNPSDDPNTDRPMNAFGGSAPSFKIINAESGEIEDVSPGSATGDIILGAQTGDTIEGTTDEEDRSIPSEVLKRQFGLRPPTPKGKLDAGIQFAPGVSMGQFMFGGLITGAVHITGSMNMFYAGQIWTGEIDDQNFLSAPSRRKNFRVDGDLRSLVTNASIGTDALDDDLIEEVDFKAGTDIWVGGRLGQIVTRDSFLGAVTVINDPNFTGGIQTPIQEVEVRGDVDELEGDASFFQGLFFGQDPRWSAPSLGDTDEFNNDDFDSPQLVGTHRSSRLRQSEVAEIAGSLNDTENIEDALDFYGMGLLAGQTVEVQLSSSEVMNVGVYNPDNLLVASDYTNKFDSQSVSGAPFRFTADRPGVYRFVVGFTGDINFNGVVDAGEGVVVTNYNPYTLTISRCADIGFGGLVALNSIGTTDVVDPAGLVDGPFPSVYVQNGDLGAVLCLSGDGGGSGGGVDTIFNAAGPYTALRGNVRAVEADSVGVTRPDDDATLAVNFRVPKGSVGLIRGRGDDLDAAIVHVNDPFVEGVGIGFDYQLVDARAAFAGNLLANRGIGVLRTAQMGLLAYAPRLSVNADNRGNDGFIDLIDCTGRFGFPGAGGPAITTGPGGNVRYIRVDDISTVVPDRFFGGAGGLVRLLPPGRSFNYTDDSGATVKLSTSPDPRNTSNEQIAPGQLQIVPYGIRDKGGSVMIDVTVLPGTELVPDGSGGFNAIIRGRGLQVDSGARGSGNVELGRVRLQTPGTNFLFNLNDRTFFAQGASATDPGDPAPVILKGQNRVDVYEIICNGIAGDGLTGLTNVENRTSGEIVNIEAQHIGRLEGHDIGVAQSRTGTEIGGLTVRRDEFPFADQRTLINVPGNIVALIARGAVGNVFCGDTIGQISANSDGLNDSAKFEGIARVIEADRHILTVEIGEGIAPSGAGEFQRAGLFCDGPIVEITGTNADIRGDVVTTGNVTNFLPQAVIRDPRTGLVIRTLDEVIGIGDITLANGSIIEADVSAARYIDAQDLPHTIVQASVINPVTGDPAEMLNALTLEGNGGIIGSTLLINDAGLIAIEGGFGFINSTLGQTADSNFGGIVTDGYGIRLSNFDGGATTDVLSARGTGKVIDTREFSPSVRQSEKSTFEPASGRLLTRLNDLHKFLGTTAKKPKNSSTSVSGTIEDSTFSGGLSLASLDAHRILGRPTEIDPSVGGPRMRMAFAQDIERVVVRENVDGLNLIAGGIGRFEVGKDIVNSTFSVTGRIQEIAANNLKSSTTIDAQGPDGVIDLIRTKRALFGRVTAATGIGTLQVGTDFASRLVSSGNDINLVDIRGSMLDGSLLRAADRIDELRIGGDIEAGATVRAKRIGTQSIGGDVDGDIQIG
jgi:hypothetical protein